MDSRHDQVYSAGLQPTLASVEPFLHLPSNSRYLTQNPKCQPSVPTPVVFLDRDGVLIEEVGYISKPEQINILDEVPEAIVRLQEHYYTMVVTNQSGIARGMFSESDLFKVHESLVRRLSADGAIIDAIYYCPHHPDGNVFEYVLECECRKPMPGLLKQASKDWNIDLAQSSIVGDMPRDIEAGAAAGVTGFFVTPDSGDSGPGRNVSSLLEAANGILK